MMVPRMILLMSLCVWLVHVGMAKAENDVGEAYRVLPGSAGHHMMPNYYEAVARETAAGWPRCKTLREWEGRRTQLRTTLRAAVGENSFGSDPPRRVHLCSSGMIWQRP
mgnify:CR=1 FL=1